MIGLLVTVGLFGQLGFDPETTHCICGPVPDSQPVAVIEVEVTASELTVVRTLLADPGAPELAPGQTLPASLAQADLTDLTRTPRLFTVHLDDNEELRALLPLPLIEPCPPVLPYLAGPPPSLSPEELADLVMKPNCKGRLAGYDPRWTLEENCVGCDSTTPTQPVGLVALLAARLLLRRRRSTH